MPAAPADIAPPARAFSLAIPPAKMLTAEEEAELYRAAVARSPESQPARRTLTAQLLLLDRYDEALEYLKAWHSNDFRLLAMEAEALLSQENDAANRRCVEVCQRALESADTPGRRAEALAFLGKAQTRLNQDAEARATLEEALTLDPGNRDAWKRAANLALRQDRRDDVLRQADELLARGVAHARIVASQSLAQAQAGDISQAKQTQGMAEFFRSFEPAPPPGWATLSDFTHDLAAELGAHPGIRFGRYGLASTKSWRIDEPGLKRLRVFPHLQELIRREILRYVRELPAPNQSAPAHPFVRAVPQAATLRNWCVVAEGEGHEAWHVHQNGWLSGTFYVQVPEHIASGSDHRGCIAFGLPGDVVGEQNAAAFGETLVRPRAGLMTMFPSHTFHRTYPHGGAGRRICYAFDVLPSPAPAQE